MVYRDLVDRRVVENQEEKDGLLVDFLDGLQEERDCLIMRLRQIDRRLVRHGRLKQETLPRRTR